MPRTESLRRPVGASDLALYTMLSEPSISPDGRRVAFSATRPNIKDDRYDSDVYVSDVALGGCAQFTFGGRDSAPRWSPDGRSILFLSKRGMKKGDRGNALYVLPSGGGEARPMVRREEGVMEPEWSPDSKIYFLSYVAKKRKDDVHVIGRVPFWSNGLGFVYDRRKHLFALDVARKEVAQLTAGGYDVEGFRVSHDGRRVAYLASRDSAPYISDVYVMDLSGGRKAKLTRSNMEIASIAWSPDDRSLALAGDDLPAGFASHARIWTLDPSTKRARLIDRVDRDKANSLNSDARAKAHASGKVTWTDDGIYYLQADGGAVGLHRVTPGGRPVLVAGGDRSIESYDVCEGAVAFVAMDDSHLEELHVAGAKERALTDLNAHVYRKLRVLTPRHVSFRASDGETIEGWVLMPEGKARVPGVLYVHGGPKTAFGHSYMHEFQAFAGAGYAVVYFNPRGSDGYSEKFADIRGRYGTRDYDDLMEGLDHALERFPRIDGKRMAIAGGSYGGFMTNWAVGHTDRFAAAVSDRSIASWTSFWGTSDIGPHFTVDQAGGDPWSAGAKLTNDSPLTYAPRVKTPLMLVHSMEDYRCWMVEGLEFFTALKKLGREAELVLFPGENHDLSRTGKPKHRVIRLGHYIRWFDAHLKDGRP